MKTVCRTATWASDNQVESNPYREMAALQRLTAMFSAAVLANRGREVGCVSWGLLHTVAHLDTSPAAFGLFLSLLYSCRHNRP